MSGQATIDAHQAAPTLETLVPLGTAGFFPSFGRQTMCFLCTRSDGRALVLDAGTGLGRLVEPPIRARIENQAPLDIVLSHYHLDHTIGLTYLTGVVQGPTRVWAPAPPLVDIEAEAALEKLIAPPLFPLALRDYPTPIEIIPYRQDFEIEGLSIRVRRQRHLGGSVGLRFGDALAYVTDTVSDDETVPFAAGVHTLLHEVWVSREEAEANPRLVLGHADAAAVVSIAERAGVGRLAAVHHHPKRSPEQLQRLLDSLDGGAVDTVVLEEGTEIQLAG